MQVWSEPSQVDAAAYEFQDTAAFLQAGEVQAESRLSLQPACSA